MSESTRVQVLLRAPADEAWWALRDPGRLREWFGWEYEGLDAEIEQIFGAADVDEERRTVDTGGGRLEVVGSEAATVLRVVREGPGGPLDAIDHGWLTFAQQLRFALERHPGAQRRTIHLAGTPRPGGQPLYELGLGDVEALAEGAPYAATLATGEAVAGEVFFREEGQVGVTVAGWGDGLLVLFGGWEELVPDGQLAMVATTYGLDDEAFAALEQRWRSWWRGRHT